MARPLSPGARQTAVVWLAWTLAGAFYITRDSMGRLYRGEAIPWVPVSVGWMAAMYIWAVFTPAILWAGRRWPLDAEHRWAHLALHTGLAVFASIASSVIEVPLLMALGVFPPVPPATSLSARVTLMLAYSFHSGVIQYAAVIALQTVMRSRKAAEDREREALELKVRGAELARQLTASQLSALKMQLQPHFLFNTLGAIMVLVQQQQRREAEAMLAKLSDLLRLAVDTVDTQEVPLARELEFLRLYLSIEQVRFADRLRVRIDADPQLHDALVPHMVLQPIVENAVRHGLGQSEDAVCIDVEAARVDGRLVLTVSDDGPGSARPLLQRKGVGLTNTENRLSGLYGEAATLVAEHRTPRGVRVTVTVPFHVAEEDAECG
jgi:two-component system, LytTR family, sensor kinase